MSSSDPAFARHRGTVEPPSTVMVEARLALHGPSYPSTEAEPATSRPKLTSGRLFSLLAMSPLAGGGPESAHGHSVAFRRFAADHSDPVRSRPLDPLRSAGGPAVPGAHPPPLRITAVESLDEVIDAMIADRVIHRHRRLEGEEGPHGPNPHRPGDSDRRPVRVQRHQGGDRPEAEDGVQRRRGNA